MPRITRTIIPKIQKSLRAKGVFRTLGRCLVGPYYVIREYRKARARYSKPVSTDEFDHLHNVETTERVHLTDLTVNSPNWVYADGYWPTPAQLFPEALSGLPISYENFVFVDLGCGKGRVLLLASEFPFKKIVGLDFARELCDVAMRNVNSYQSATQRCRDISVLCMDFVDYDFPTEPLFVYLYNPSSLTVTSAVAKNLAKSLAQNPRPIWVLYVTPAYDLFGPGSPLLLKKVKHTNQFALFSNAAVPPPLQCERACSGPGPGDRTYV